MEARRVTVRTLSDTAADVALGRALVHEYVEATATEIGQDLATILPATQCLGAPGSGDSTPRGAR